MICLNCKKQISDDVSICPHCGREVFPKHQLIKEIGFRRQQRWFFYIILVSIFLGMLGLIIKVYNANNKILLEMGAASKELRNKSEELNKVKSTLDVKAQEMSRMKNDLEAEKLTLTNKLSERDQQLALKIEETEKTLSERSGLEKEIELLSAVNDGLKKIFTNFGTGISNTDLNKIPLAEPVLAGLDSDKDGLNDELEASLGTDKSKTDTDSDGFDDKREIMAGFNPLGGGKINIDQTFAAKQKGKIFIQIEAQRQLWYVDSDGRRHFFGK